jgi:hypothetical protein
MPSHNTHPCLLSVIIPIISPHLWCICYHASLRCGRSWVPALSCQTNDYQSCISRISAQRAALRYESNYWLAWNQNNLFDWSDISIRGCVLWLGIKIDNVLYNFLMLNFFRILFWDFITISLCYVTFSGFLYLKSISVDTVAYIVYSYLIH